MARIMLIGEVAHIELTIDDYDGGVIAECRKHAGIPSYNFAHGCRWTQKYDDLRDAAEYAADHADRGR